MHILDKKNIKGFTIVETLVAITILMISIAGPLTVAQRGFMAGVYAKDEVTASYLAQDLLEFVKNVRDNNVLASPPRTWLQNLTSGNSCNSINSICKLDTLYTDPINPGTSLSTCSKSDETCRLYTDANGYTTSSSGTTPTKFYRYFYINQNNSNPDKQARLIVVVTWNNGIDNNVTYENEIFNIIK